MLELYKSPLLQVEESGSIHDVPFSAEPSIAEYLAKGFGFIRRQFFIILSFLPLTVGLAVAYLHTTPPRYSAEARILVDTGKVQVSSQPIFGENNPFTFLAVIDSQIEILKSDSFALSIIKNLHLTEDPEFVGSNRGPGTIDRLLHALASNKSKPESSPEQRALAVFERGLTVGRLGATYVIEVEYQSIDPDRAAQIANAVADEFIRDQMEAKYQTIGKATAWLQDRLTELRTQASAAEHAVVEYKTKHNIVDTGGHLINEQQLSELNSALLKARADSAEAKARLDRVSQILNSEDPDPAAAQVATVADALKNEVISKLRQQYLEQAQREAILSNRIGHDHLAVVNIRNQMREIRRSIFDEFKRIAEAYKSEYEIAKARENSLQVSLAATVSGSQTANNAQVELRQLEGAAQSYRTLYNNFQQRYTDFVQQQSFPMTEAQITRALPPSVSTSPKSLRILAMATAAGLAIGFGVAMLREIVDRVFRTIGQVEARLKRECVAMLPIITPIPKGDAIGSKDGSVGNKAGANFATARIIAPNTPSLRYVVDSPLSRYAEVIAHRKDNCRSRRWTQVQQSYWDNFIVAQ